MFRLRPCGTRRSIHQSVKRIDKICEGGRAENERDWLFCLCVHDRGGTRLQGFERIDDHRLDLPLDLDWRQLAQAHVTETSIFLDQILYASGSFFTDYDGKPQLAGQVLEAGREVHMVPDHRIVHSPAFSTDISHDHLAGMDSDPSPEGNPPLGFPLLLQLRQLLLHVKSADRKSTRLNSSHVAISYA